MIKGHNSQIEKFRVLKIMYHDKIFQGLILWGTNFILRVSLPISQLILKN